MNREPEHQATSLPHALSASSSPKLVQARCSMLGLVLLASFPLVVARAQQPVPIVDLPPASAKTPTAFGAVLGVREGSNGNVFINDAGRRQLLLYDTTLAAGRILFDSAPGLPNSYGPIRVPLVPY